MERVTSTVGAITALLRALIVLFFLVMFDLASTPPSRQILPVVEVVSWISRVNGLLFFVAIYVTYIVATDWKRRLPIHLVLGVEVGGSL